MLVGRRSVKASTSCCPCGHFFAVPRTSTFLCRVSVKILSISCSSSPMLHSLLPSLHSSFTWWLSASNIARLSQVRPSLPPAPGRGPRHSLQPQTWAATSFLQGFVSGSSSLTCQGYLLQQVLGTKPCGTSLPLLCSLKQSHTLLSRISGPFPTQTAL